MKTILLSIFSLLFLNFQAQTLDNVNPDFGDLGQTVPVTITGSNTSFTSTNGNFNFLQGTYALSFNASISNNTTASGDINLYQAGTNTIPTGFYDLQYRFLQGTFLTYNLTDAFFVNAALNGTFTISGNILQGTPKMDAGDPMVYAKIFLENTSGEILKLGRTDANGFVSFADLTAGTYVLHIEDHNNSSPLSLQVGDNMETTDLTIEFKDGNLVNGINDNLFAEKFDFKLYPTVFSDKIMISMNLEEAKDLNFTLLNINGQKVFTKAFQNQKAKTSLSFSKELTSVNNGVYFLEVSIGNEIKTFKLIKQ